MTDTRRYVIKTKLLGMDQASNKRGKEIEYAIEVVLSDESQYTMYRSLKEIANFHTKILNKFKVEAGYFKKEERVIPECPIKQSIFGPQRAIREDQLFGRLLDDYIRTIPGLPAAVVKSDLVIEFFSLKASDLDAPDEPKSAEKKKKEKIQLNDDSDISKPISLKSYLTISDFNDPKTKFSFKEGTTVQLIQKDPGGWWMVDAQGLIGWAPASYLVPVNETEDEEQENKELIEQEREGTRYISISAYQASREDELSFVKGAVVRVKKKFVDGWWLVRYNGGEGFVPGAMFHKFDKRQATIYLKKIKRNFTTRGGSTRIVPTVQPKWLNAPRNGTRRVPPSGAKIPVEVKPGESAPKPPPMPVEVKEEPAETARSSEKAQNEKLFTCKGSFSDNGISIRENDNVKVLDDSDEDWWFIEDAQGANGWAPANYLAPILPPHTDKMHSNRTDVVSDISNYHQQQQQQQQRGLDSSLNGIPEVDDMEEDMDDIDCPCDSLDIDECYVVVRDYVKSSVDELDLFEGQIVCVIDSSDSDIWYVNVDGKEGWVPSDTVRLMGENELESSRESTPGDPCISADNSELSDDDQGTGVIRRRLQLQKHKDHIDSAGLPTPPPVRPRSAVIHRDYSPMSNGNSPRGSLARDVHTPHKSGGQRGQLHLSDGSDSDHVSSSPLSKKVIRKKSLDELEKEIEAAERQAREAKLKAERLKEQLYMAKQRQK